MKVFGLLGLFLVWLLILLLVGLTWVTWSIQKSIIWVVINLNDRFFDQDSTKLKDLF